MYFNSYFYEKRKGVYTEVTLPQYGNQDVGITPDGVMDQFAFDCGNAILGNPEGSPALEMIFPPVFEVKQNLYFILTGAVLSGSRLILGDTTREIVQNIINYAPVGSFLHFGKRMSGLRSYLCFTKAHHDLPMTSILERNLPEHIQDWSEITTVVRVIRGPEYGYLENPNDFLTANWSVTTDSNQMGLRLESNVKLLVRLENMISEAVTSGTVQVTARGPIVLLKHRQTVGGYPRVFAVISADLDLLAQYAPGQCLKFKEIDIEKAWHICRQKREFINSIRTKYCKS